MDQFDFFPPKPELIEHKPKSGLSLTFFSIVLFVLAFIMLFGDEVNFIIYLLIVLLIHELGHFLTMKMYNYKNVRMLFVPLMGAFVQGVKTNYSQKESFIVTSAGPIPGVIIGSIAMWYSTVVQSFWMIELSSLFLLLNIVNLLPLDPLDGGQLFKLFVRKNNELFLMIFAFISSIVMIGVGWYLNSYVIMLFGFFMGFRVRAMQKKYQMHKELNEEDVNYSTTYKLLSNRDFVKIKEVVLEATPALRKYVEEVSLDESGPILASQVNNVLITPLKNDASIIFKVVLLILWLVSFFMPLILFFLLDFNWYFNGI